MFGRGRSRGSQPHRGAMHEGRDLLDEGWVYSVGCGGSCSTHNLWPVLPEARGVAGRDVTDCAGVEVVGTVASSAPWLHGTVLVLVGFGGSGGGRLTESGTAFGARNVPFLQMTEVVPQSSGGKRSPRRRSTSPIRPSVTTLRSYSAVR